MEDILQGAVLLHSDTEYQDQIKRLPDILRKMGPLISNWHEPIPGFPFIREAEREWVDGYGALVKTPWGMAQSLWSTLIEELHAFVPMYRILVPNDNPLPEPQVPDIGYAVWDTITGIVAVYSNRYPEPVYLRPEFPSSGSIRDALKWIRMDLAEQGIPIFPTRLYRRDSMPYPWDGVPTRQHAVSNREVTVPLVGYALDGVWVVYLHIVGPKTALRSIWATLQTRKPVSIAADRFLTGGGTGNYASHTEPIPGTRDYRLIVLDRRALAGDGEVAYLVIPGGKGRRDWSDEDRRQYTMIFAERLDSVLPVPILPEWGEALVKAGSQSGLIRCLDIGGDVDYGCVISRDDRWIEIVRALVQSGEIGGK
jgi:hypothetical protein